MIYYVNLEIEVWSVFEHQKLLRKITLIGLAFFTVFFAQLTLPIPFEFQYDIRFTWTLLGIIAYFCIVDFRDPKSLAKNAFWFIAIFGTVIALVRPVQYALDEESHLKNTIGLSDSFVFKYSEEHLADYEAVFKHDALRSGAEFQGKDYWEAVEHQESQIAGDPIGFDNPAYLPGALGWNLGELLSSKVKVSYYLGRIATVLVYALLVFLAVRQSRVYKTGIFLFGTLPSALYVTAGFHYDYLYYGASLLIISLLTNVFSGVYRLTIRRVLIIQGLAFLLVFAKFPYVLLAILPLFLPRRYYEDKRVKPFAVLNFLLIMTTGSVYAGIINIFKVTTFASSQSPGILYFLREPLPIIRTFISAPFVITEHFISRPLQYIRHESGFLVSISAICFFTMFLLVALTTKIRISRTFQLLALGLVTCISFLTIYAITGDPRVYRVGDAVVGGVQGRYYFFPFAFLPVFLSDWIHRFVQLPHLTTEVHNKFVTSLQLVNTYLMILTIGVALYTQL